MTLIDPQWHRCVIEGFDKYVKEQGMCDLLCSYPYYSLMIYHCHGRSMPSGPRYVYALKQWYLSTGIWDYYGDLMFEKFDDSFDVNDRVTLIVFRFLTVLPCTLSRSDIGANPHLRA